MTTIYFLKSDNIQAWVSESFYQELRLQMSTGDFHTHRARSVQLDPNQLEDLKYHSGKQFIDLVPCGEEQLIYDYDGAGDCHVQEF